MDAEAFKDSREIEGLANFGKVRDNKKRAFPIRQSSTVP
jgi:hypothetical protein